MFGDFVKLALKGLNENVLFKKDFARCSEIKESFPGTIMSYEFQIRVKSSSIKVNRTDNR